MYGGATVCACPSTEANLGDGIVRADELLAAGAQVALGTDSHARQGMLEEAQALESHLRLLRGRRNVLDTGRGVAPMLLDSLTSAGARSLGLGAYKLTPGAHADFVTIDLTHPAVAGVDDERVLNAAPSGAVCEVYVAGRRIVEGGQHPRQQEIAQGFTRALRELE